MTKIEITELGHLGDGLAWDADTRHVLPGGLPGDVINVPGNIDTALVTSSPHRVRPPCPHARDCGGCSVQHASDAFIDAWKQSLVKTALRGQGIEAETALVATSAARTRRRAALTAMRTRKGVRIGFRRRESHDLITLAECHVLDPRIFGAFDMLAAIARPVLSRKGAVTVHVTATETGLDVDVRGGKALEPAAMVDVVSLARDGGCARLSLDGEIQATFAPPLVDFDGVKVSPPPGGFLQATPEAEVAIAAEVSRILASRNRIADLFSGCGTFALRLARHADVRAYESDAASLVALDMAWRGAEGLHEVTHEARDLFRRPVLPDELARVDAVVIDPPRAGAEAQMRMLATSGVGTIAAVSCNPVSFARDARILFDGGYRLARVAVVDQFRWSHHVELVAGFSKDEAVRNT